MELNEEKSGFYAAILFLIWPLLSVVSAFKNFRTSWAKNILWAFVAFYGFVFAIGAENKSADIVRYVEEYQNLHNEVMTIESTHQYFETSGEIDVVRTFIAVTLSRFTDNQAVLTLVYGIIFGFFFSRNMWFILERIEGRLKPVVLLLFVCFFMVVPIWNMNGFRMWTAAHIFIYGLLPFLFDGNKGGVFISTLSILVHFSFIVPVITLLSFLFIGNRLVIYFAFFLVTFFISEIDLAMINNIVEIYAPEAIQERTSGYRNEEYVENYRQGTEENRVWYARWYGAALKWSVMGFLVVLFFRGKDIFIKNRNWLKLFCFTLFFYGVANLLSSLPSGGRFLAIANLVALPLIILYIQNFKQERFLERYTWIVSPALLLYAIVSFRIGLYSMSATAVLGNPIVAFFFQGEHISLNDFIRIII